MVRSINCAACSMNYTVCSMGCARCSISCTMNICAEWNGAELAPVAE